MLQHRLLGALLGMPLTPLAGLLRKAQAQGVVLAHHAGQRPTQLLRIDRLAQVQQHRLVPVGAMGHGLLEEPLLDRRQRRLPNHRRIAVDGRLATHRDPRQTLHGLVLEQVLGLKRMPL